MLIWKYDENNKITHLNMIEVPNDHQLSSDELKTLPDDFLTPAKLVNGVLTSATQEESDKAAEDYRKDNDISLTATPTQAQQSIAMLSTQVAQLGTQIQALQSIVQSQNQTIQKLVNVNSTSTIERTGK